MQRFYGEKRDEYGRAEAGASVSVYDTGTSNLSVIYSASDPLTTPSSAIPNPLTTDANGLYGFAAPTGVYDIVIHGSGSAEYKNKVAMFDQTTSTTTTAGGASTQIQYNTGGVLTGSASLTTDGTNLTVGGYESVEAVRFNTSTPDTSNVVGNTYWDSTNGTLATVLDSSAGVVLQHGQELYVACVNKTGVIIPDGSVVYVNDAQGNRPTCALAKANSITTCQVIGMTTQAIGINATGLVTVAGDVHGFNTSVFSGDGKTLYLSATTAGVLTETAPTSPNYVVVVGTNLNTTNNGTIFINPSRPIATESTLASNLDVVSPSQKATKTYADGLDAALRSDLASTASTALGDALVGVKSALTGGVDTTQHQVNSEWISVFRWFTPEQIADVQSGGAPTIDCTAAIQAALDGVGWQGGILYFPRGKYLVSDAGSGYCLRIQYPIHIMGSGPMYCAIQPNASVSASTDCISMYPNTGYGEDSTCIEGIYFGNPSTGTMAGRHSIYAVTAATGQYLPKLQLHNNQFGTSANGYSFKHLHISPDLQGGMYGAVFTGNVFRSGVWLEGSGDSNVMRDNTMTGTGLGVYVLLAAGASCCTIDDNNITASGGAIKVDRGTRISIRHNNIECAGAGSNSAVIDFNGTYASWGGQIENNLISALTGATATMLLRLKAVYGLSIKDNVFSAPSNAFATAINLVDGSCINTRIGANTYNGPFQYPNSTVCPTWSSGTAYTAGQYAYYNNLNWISIQNGTNKAPDSATGYQYWTLTAGPRILDSGTGTCGVIHALPMSVTTPQWIMYAGNRSVPQYYKDCDGMVHISGAIAGGTWGSGTQFATMPTGFRPTQINTFATFGLGGTTGGLSGVQVYQSGEVCMYATGSTTMIGLDGISYPAMGLADGASTE